MTALGDVVFTPSDVRFEVYNTYLEIEARQRQDSPLHSLKKEDEKTRARLIEWLIYVVKKAEMKRQTLFLTINMLDRISHSTRTASLNYQLVGFICLFIASKYEEMYPPHLCDLIEEFAPFTVDDVLSNEQCILGVLDYSLSVPTVDTFLAEYISMSNLDTSPVMYAHLDRLLEFSLYSYDMMMFPASIITFSCVYLTFYTFLHDHLPQELLDFAGYTEETIKDAVKSIYTFYERNVTGDQTSFTPSMKKYFRPTHQSPLYIRPPPKSFFQ